MSVVIFIYLLLLFWNLLCPQHILSLLGFRYGIKQPNVGKIIRGYSLNSCTGISVNGYAAQYLVLTLLNRLSLLQISEYKSCQTTNPSVKSPTLDYRLYQLTRLWELWSVDRHCWSPNADTSRIYRCYSGELKKQSVYKSQRSRLPSLQAVEL